YFPRQEKWSGQNGSTHLTMTAKLNSVYPHKFGNELLMLSRVVTAVNAQKGIEAEIGLMLDLGSSVLYITKGLYEKLSLAPTGSRKLQVIRFGDTMKDACEVAGPIAQSESKRQMAESCW